jgi:hypothetical protein
VKSSIRILGSIDRNKLARTFDDAQVLKKIGDAPDDLSAL